MTCVIPSFYYAGKSLLWVRAIYYASILQEFAFTGYMNLYFISYFSSWLYFSVLLVHPTQAQVPLSYFKSHVFIPRNSNEYLLFGARCYNNELQGFVLFHSQATLRFSVFSQFLFLSANPKQLCSHCWLMEKICRDNKGSLLI